MSFDVITNAFVLKKKSLLGQDLLVLLFTEEFGKIAVMAKGAKKITSRRLPHLETGNLIKAHINKRMERWYLAQTELISGFVKLKKDEKKVNALYQFFFVLGKLLPEDQEEKKIYSLTKSFFIKLSSSAFSEQFIDVFFRKLLISLGYEKSDSESGDIRYRISELINEKIPTFDI